MQRYKIKVEYDGTNFVGWQYQKNGLSIQEILQKAIFQFSKEKVTVTGAGRTDAGVHAIGQVAHFDLKKKFKKKNFILGVNTPNEYEQLAADLNQDLNINVLDVVILVNTILSVN